MTYSPEETGKIIKEERKKLNWTQDRLGKELHVSGKQVSNYERGELLPPDQILIEMCKLFNCEKGYLLGEPDYSNKTKLYTHIFEVTGLNESSINAIMHITGDSKQSLDFGYNNREYRKILNNLFSSTAFRHFVKSLLSLEELYSNSPFQELLEEIGEDRLNQASDNLKLPYEVMDEEELSRTFSSEQLNDMILLNQAIDNEDKLKYDIKVARYSVYEAFEAVLSDLYPENRQIK